MSLLTTKFGATSTAAEVVAGTDLSNERAIVTGSSSGIGTETARALAGAGAEVTLAVRNSPAGQRVAEDIIATTGNPRVKVAFLDLADRAAVASFVASWEGPLDILVNNAGVMATPETRTPEGWELQFAVNYLGHFALATGLHKALAKADGARIVSVSSAGHLRSPVVFDDIHFRHRPYDPFLAYGQSKTANILFAVEASRRWAADGIFANAVMPGAVRTPGVDSLQFTPSGGSPDFFWKTPEQGAATSVLVATSPLLDGIGGRYFDDCNEAAPNVPGSRTGVAAYALDPEQAKRLWETSLRMIS